ncbi:DUF2637 domain-containing protein [Streptomyces sp. NPDC127197]|uniref:DUF2637 domain-containing protein n=1 Tax=Streptomyces sp. NPDC127197 TaxID=3345388 RepID=UPI0036433AB5
MSIKPSDLREELKPLTTTQIRVIAAAGTLSAALAILGGISSFKAVEAAARPMGFGDHAWMVPIGVDLGILVLLIVDLVLEWTDMALPPMRWLAWGFTAATIAFNVASVPPEVTGFDRYVGQGMHAAMPLLFIAFMEGVRHAVRHRVGLANGRRMEGVRFTRWMMDPIGTALLRRRMILWEIRSYETAVKLEEERRKLRARLRRDYGFFAWRWKAPLADRWMVTEGRPYGEDPTGGTTAPTAGTTAPASAPILGIEGATGDHPGTIETPAGTITGDRGSHGPRPGTITGDQQGTEGAMVPHQGTMGGDHALYAGTNTGDHASYAGTNGDHAVNIPIPEHVSPVMTSDNDGPRSPEAVFAGSREHGMTEQMDPAFTGTNGDHGSLEGTIPGTTGTTYGDHGDHDLYAGVQIADPWGTNGDHGSPKGSMDPANLGNEGDDDSDVDPANLRDLIDDISVEKVEQARAVALQILEDNRTITRRSLRDYGMTGKSSTLQALADYLNAEIRTGHLQVA